MQLRLIDFFVYRNAGVGVKISYSPQSLLIQGGIYADNRGSSIDVHQPGNVVVIRNATIIGQSSSLQRIQQQTRLTGDRLSPIGIGRYSAIRFSNTESATKVQHISSSSSPNTIQLEHLLISGFLSSQSSSHYAAHDCVSSLLELDPTFVSSTTRLLSSGDSSLTVANITLQQGNIKRNANNNDQITNVVQFCSLTKDMNTSTTTRSTTFPMDVFVVDKDSSLYPTTTMMMNNGYIDTTKKVSTIVNENHKALTFLTKTVGIPLSNQCGMYLPGICLRTVLIYIDPTYYYQHYSSSSEEEEDDDEDDDTEDNDESSSINDNEIDNNIGLRVCDSTNKTICVEYESIDINVAAEYLPSYLSITRPPTFALSQKEEMLEGRTITETNNNAFPVLKQRVFAVTLPKGQYEGKFFHTNNNNDRSADADNEDALSRIWPTFVQQYWNNDSPCMDKESDYLSEEGGNTESSLLWSISIPPPLPSLISNDNANDVQNTTTICNRNLIRSSIDSPSKTFWIGGYDGIGTESVVSSSIRDENDLLLDNTNLMICEVNGTSRSPYDAVGYSMGQYLDTRCLKEFQEYTFTMNLKTTRSSSSSTRMGTEVGGSAMNNDDDYDDYNDNKEGVQFNFESNNATNYFWNCSNSSTTTTMNNTNLSSVALCPQVEVGIQFVSTDGTTTWIVKLDTTMIVIDRRPTTTPNTTTTTLPATVAMEGRGSHQVEGSGTDSDTIEKRTNIFNLRDNDDESDDQPKNGKNIDIDGNNIDDDADNIDDDNDNKKAGHTKKNNRGRQLLRGQQRPRRQHQPLHIHDDGRIRDEIETSSTSSSEMLPSSASKEAEQQDADVVMANTTTASTSMTMTMTLAASSSNTTTTSTSNNTNINSRQYNNNHNTNTSNRITQLSTSFVLDEAMAAASSAFLYVRNTNNIRPKQRQRASSSSSSGESDDDVDDIRLLCIDSVSLITTMR
jgi:hypothetical protein